MKRPTLLFALAISSSIAFADSVPSWKYAYLPHDFSTLPVIYRPDLKRMQNPELRDTVRGELDAINQPHILWVGKQSPWQNNGFLSKPWASSSLTLTDGSKSITVSGVDGSVKIVGYTPDEASVEFWAKVTAAFPAFKAGLIEGARK